MDKWALDLKHEGIKEAYNNYLFSIENTLTYYLACVAFNDHTVFMDEDLSTLLRASDNFHDSFTSMKSIADIKSLKDSGEFANLARSHCIFALTTAFTDFFEALRRALDIDPNLFKAAVPFRLAGGRIYSVRPGSLKLAHYLSNKYSLRENLTNEHELMHINSLISLRHMYVHEHGRFSENYREHVTLRWQQLSTGDRILFNKNDFDDTLHFYNMNLIGFVRSLDKKLDA